MRIRDTEWLDVVKVVAYVAAIALVVALSIWGRQWERDRIADTVIERMERKGEVR